MENRIRLILKKGEERRVRSGHLWIFSNEVDRLEGRLEDGETPDIVEVYSMSGQRIGTGIYNPHTLLSVRLLRHGNWKEFKEYLEEQILSAIRLPTRRLTETDVAHRLIHSEGDGLPGLVVDQFGDCLSVQITTRAMESRRMEILAILTDALSPRAIRVDNNLASRETEGLPLSPDVYQGDVPDTLSVPVGGIQVQFAFRTGQKTGLFLDQHDNIRALDFLFSGKSVLDAFCYVGGWSMAAAKEGARTVTGIDDSAQALEFYEENMTPFAKRCDVSSIKADFFDWAPEAVRQGTMFDAVVLDPPAFIKSRKKKEEGLKGYYAANEFGISLVRTGGIYVTCSCSALLEWEDLFGILRDVMRRKKRTPRLIYQGRAAMDHPRVLAMPELDYLKCLAFIL
ncbi:MAG: class I SAM-dependent rRNA methyltransferase [Leptospirales bacterium]